MYGFSRYSLPMIVFFGWLMCYLLKVVFWPRNEEALPWHLRLIPLVFALVCGAITAYFVVMTIGMPRPLWR